VSAAALAAAALLVLAPQATKRAAPPADPRVEDGPYFVADKVGDKEGAPPAKNLGKLVVLTDLAKSDP